MPEPQAGLVPPDAQGQRLGLGGAALGNLFSAIPEADAQAVLAAALADGCRSFDTAPHYGNGLSEHRFGQALRGLPRGSFTLSSKVGRVLRPDAQAPRDQHGYVQVLPFTQRWDYSAAGTRRSVEDSLQRLGLAHLDMAYVHDCDAATHGADHPRVLAQVLDETLPTLRALQREGLVRHVGLGVNDVQICLDVLAHADLDGLLLAGRYSLIDHSALAALLPLCQARGVRIALGGVYNSGILATGVGAGGELRFNYARAPQAWVERVAAVERVCADHAVPLRAAALQFPLAHPAIAIVMAGAQSVAQWQDSRAMLAHPIPAAFWRALREQGLLPKDAPTP
ncbi:aldo/keto reductase [Pseudorhodoferax sp. Leaf267]|uniref:aldo/keto reductase n=1 Tax=Pseudorhodoferax sp. Leaf267 TaxID=1736316 RepID=UPI0006F9BC0F|nr:aldo/keto reductase [Pseudorhodoferax sp. Leaf267]KQP21574.1 aldo/keto reductase [Pseudorhodoferax sp. Leaf267]